MKSNRFQLNGEDIKRFLKNALIFLAPVLIVILTQLSQTQNVDWNIVYIYAINLVVDLLRKFVAGDSK